MLAWALLTIYFGGDALKIVTYILNRVAMKTVNSTSNELCTRRSPDLRHMHLGDPSLTPMKAEETLQYFFSLSEHERVRRWPLIFLGVVGHYRWNGDWLSRGGRNNERCIFIVIASGMDSHLYKKFRTICRLSNFFYIT